jgi:pimeloyl-ACP methyl ester carboxylesterase
MKKVCIVLVCLGALPTIPAARAPLSASAGMLSGSPAPSGSGFVPSPCPFVPAPDQIEGQTLRCGFVTVPEDRTRPLERQVHLAVAIFTARGAATRAPLVFIGGGPGTFVLDSFGPRVTGSLAQDLASNRDFVMFDPRGVGFSQPSLYCDELRDMFYSTIGTYRTRAQRTDDRIAAALACRDRLAGSGINLAAYTTETSAADVNDLRIALGYGPVDVWGLSYGTRFGLRVERDFPHAVRSLVLDSALPPSVNQLVDRAANAERAFRVLFDACAADAACASAYPALEQRFYDLVAALNATPAAFYAQHPRTGVVSRVVLTGDLLIQTLNDALVQAFLIPLVPLAIAATSQGDFTLMSQATSLLSFDDGHSSGMFYSVNCVDEANQTTAPRVAAARRTVRPEIVLALDEEARLRICEAWGAAESRSSARTPVVSDAPALILAGEYDPLTPPDYGVITGRTLRNSYLFEFPAVGHNVHRSTPCAHSMMMAFLANPDVAPDAACIEGLPPPAWVVPSSFTAAPVR